MRIRKISEDGYLAIKSTLIKCETMSYTMTFTAIVNMIFKENEPWISLEYGHNGATFGQAEYGTISTTKDIDIFLSNEMKDLCTHWSLYPEAEKNFINEFKKLVNEAIKKEVLK